MQEVQLDSKVKLLDSPGVVLASGDMKSDASVALRNAIRTGKFHFFHFSPGHVRWIGFYLFLG